MGSALIFVRTTDNDERTKAKDIFMHAKAEDIHSTEASTLAA